MNDPYQVLGVSRNASKQDIQSAFRKKAIEHHPDRGGDAEKFKEVNAAYQVLSDDKKRAAYDRFGEAGVNAGFGRQGGTSGFSGFDDLFRGSGFSSGFGSGGVRFSFGSGGLGDIFDEMFGQTMSQVQVEAEISLTQAILGDRLKFKTRAGDELELRIPSGTQDGTTFRFAGKGNPHRRGQGDLLVTVRVQLPRRLNRTQKELFEQLKQSGL